ncbi:hypothetical protein K503DRAFT_786876, partial [Rhizopogon vinicolor AM-OR11-026]
RQNQDYILSTRRNILSEQLGKCRSRPQPETHPQLTKDVSLIMLQIIDDAFCTHVPFVSLTSTYNVTADHTPLFKMNLPNQARPHARFPATKTEIWGLTENALNILLREYRVVMPNGLSLAKRRNIFAHFIGVAVAAPSDDENDSEDEYG